MRAAVLAFGVVMSCGDPQQNVSVVHHVCLQLCEGVERERC